MQLIDLLFVLYTPDLREISVTGGRWDATWVIFLCWAHMSSHNYSCFVVFCMFGAIFSWDWLGLSILLFWNIDKQEVMASPTRERSSPSDNNEPDERQEKHLEEVQSHIQYQPPATGIMGIAPPSADYVLPLSHVEATAYPYANPYYGNMVAAYGAQALVHPQVMGIQAGVPLPSDTVEEPVYVNAKQYHGILRRRQSRAKAESENKMLKNRKPYLHESRHLHALRRARGNGGRFLNAKTDKDNLENDATSHANARNQELERCNVENQMQNRQQIIRSEQEN